jgi:hypothetical protein
MVCRLLLILLVGLPLAGLHAPRGAAAKPPAPPQGETAQPDRPGWAVATDSGCWLWNTAPNPDEVLVFTGTCPQGPAEGSGEGEWRWREEGRIIVERFGGTYRNGRIEGLGFIDYGDGERYDGAFRAGMFHGQGVYVWPDGRRFEGQWRDDLPDGPGVHTSPDATIRGVWRSGCLFDGATLLMAVGRERDECDALAPRPR